MFWEDTFGYPNGDLTGQGPWEPNPDFPASLIVASGAVKTDAMGSASNAAEGVIEAVDLDGNWTCEIDILIPAAPSAASDVVIYLGPSTSLFVACVIAWDTATIGANKADVSTYTTAGDTSDNPAAACPFNTLSLHVLQKIDDTITHKIGGVLVDTLVLTFPIAAPAPYFFVQIDGAVQATTPTVTRVSMRQDA